MSLINGFTRTEVIKLTTLSSQQLAYFERIKLVIPKKYGSLKKPTCIYTWEQLLELIAISGLRRKVSLQTIRKVAENFEQMGCKETLRDKHLVVVGNDVFWVEDNWKDFPEKIQKVSAKTNEASNYVFAFMITIDDLINSVWKNAQKSSEINFESFRERAKAKPINKVA